MKCFKCEGKLAARGYEHVTKIAGFTVTDGTGHVLVCEQCGEPSIGAVELAGYERRAAQQILMGAEKPVSGAVLKYARKALGLKQKEMAALLGTNEQQVSRWENEPEADRRLRLAVASILGHVESGHPVSGVAAEPGADFAIRKAS